MSRQFSQKAQELMAAKSRKGPSKASRAFTEWRHQTGKTLREIAETIGCTQTIIVGWCGGKHVPSIEVARRIEELTGIPIVWWVLPPEAKDTIAEIESLTLDADGPEVEPEPVRGPADLADALPETEPVCPPAIDLSSYLEDALGSGGVE